MKIRTPVFWILFLMYIFLNNSEAKPLFKQHFLKRLECGSFTVYADTERVMPADGYWRTTAQSLKIQFQPHGSLHALDLGQHKSRDPTAGGILAVDGTADTWRCVISDSQKPFVFIRFSCENDYATSCPTWNTADGKEWQQIYDSAGRVYLRYKRRISKKEEATLRASGIWNWLFKSYYITPDSHIY